MAQNFKRAATRGVGNTQSGVGGYSVPANTSVTVIGLSVANVSNVPATVDLCVMNGGNGIVAYIVKGAPLPVAGTLVAVGGDQKLVLQKDDWISAIINGVGASADVLMSLLELS